MDIEDTNFNSTSTCLSLYRKEKNNMNDNEYSGSEDDQKKKQQRIFNLMDFYKQRNEKYKQVNFHVDYIERFLAPEKEFYLVGDMIVEDFLDKSEPSQIVKASNWQSWRRVVKVEFRKDIQCLETQNENLVSGLSQFSQVIQILQSKGDEQLYKLSCLITNYQKVIEILNGERVKLVTYFKLYPQLVEAQEQVFKIWLEDCYKWLKKNMKPNEMYTYEVGRIDFNKMEHQEYLFGISKELLYLLGTDEKTAVNIALRFGKVEFFTEATRFYNITQKLLFALTQHRDPNRQVKYDIITLEGIIIPVTVKIQSPQIPVSQNIPGLSEQPFYQAFGQVLTIVRYEIEDMYIKQIESIRKQALVEKNYDLDFSYTMESTLLLEKFYKNEYNQFQQNTQKDVKRCEFTPL